MTVELAGLTIKKANEHLKKGDFSAVELAKTFLRRIEERNSELNVFIEVFDDVLKQAEEADKKIKSGNPGLLTGIPMALKDNMLVKGRKVSACSKILEGYVAPYTATAIEKLLEQNAVLLGRTNMDEFAMGSSTETSYYGVTRNPFDSTRVAGGSSGGAAAAVGANMALATLGSDTAGSVRQPASFCGSVGFKPTYGTISRHGLIAMGSSLDIIGPITRTVEDTKILFDAISGKDPLDGTTIDLQIRNSKFDIRNCTVGVPRNFLDMKGLDPEVLQNFNENIARLQKAGCKIKDISLPTIPYSLAVYYTIMPAELSTNLARYDGVKFGYHAEGETLLDDYLLTRGQGFGREARRRILLGTYVLSAGYYDAYYRKAIQVRSKIEKEFIKAFGEDGLDVIATPTTPAPAFKTGEKTKDPLSMYLEDIFTVPANIGGVPALSVPSGFVERQGKKLPVGVQFTGAYGKDYDLFALGEFFESIRE